MYRGEEEAEVRAFVFVLLGWIGPITLSNIVQCRYRTGIMKQVSPLVHGLFNIFPLLNAYTVLEYDR